jgi:hypothetical protein
MGAMGLLCVSALHALASSVEARDNGTRYAATGRGTSAASWQSGLPRIPPAHLAGHPASRCMPARCHSVLRGTGSGRVRRPLRAGSGTPTPTLPPVQCGRFLVLLAALRMSLFDIHPSHTPAHTTASHACYATTYPTIPKSRSLKRAGPCGGWPRGCPWA